MTLEEQFFTTGDYDKDYENLVNSLGFLEIQKHIPFTYEQLKKAFDESPHLNSLSLKKWEDASGILVDNKTKTNSVINPWFYNLLAPYGITAVAQAQVISTLKCAARMWIQATPVVSNVVKNLFDDNEGNNDTEVLTNDYNKGYYEGYHDAMLDIMVKFDIPHEEEYCND